MFHVVRRLASLASAVAFAALVSACVTEGEPVLPEAPQIFVFEENLLEAGAYHGVTFFFQIDIQRSGGEFRSSDLPEFPSWREEERGSDGVYYRQLPPLKPEMGADGRDVYRLRDIHRVDYLNSMFEVGKYRYLRMPRARLYVFKRRVGDFAFSFRGQRIVVPSNVPWVPSVYYYVEKTAPGTGPDGDREVVLLGLSRIESNPETGTWHVDGRRYVPDPTTPLRLDGAIHAKGTR